MTGKILKFYDAGLSILFGQYTPLGPGYKPKHFKGGPVCCDQGFTCRGLWLRYLAHSWLCLQKWRLQWTASLSSGCPGGTKPGWRRTKRCLQPMQLSEASCLSAALCCAPKAAALHSNKLEGKLGTCVIHLQFV